MSVPDLCTLLCSGITGPTGAQTTCLDVCNEVAGLTLSWQGIWPVIYTVQQDAPLVVQGLPELVQTSARDTVLILFSPLLLFLLVVGIVLFILLGLLGASGIWLAILALVWVGGLVVIGVVLYWLIPRITERFTPKVSQLIQQNWQTYKQQIGTDLITNILSYNPSN